jgi:hypothetical protein
MRRMRGRCEGIKAILTAINSEFAPPPRQQKTGCQGRRRSHKTTMTKSLVCLIGNVAAGKCRAPMPETATDQNADDQNGNDRSAAASI